MMTKQGTEVVIMQDCRDGGEATGQIGIYEGEFTVLIDFMDEKITANSPRIRLQDGSVIWGAECWWSKLE
jgi:hypothetical protein